MNAIVLDEPGHFSYVKTDPIGILQQGYARVRVHRVGICGTDFHAFQGNQTLFSYPRVLGHELGVEVTEISEASGDIRVGDLCSVEPYLNCETCVACRRGKPNCCARIRVLGVSTDGGMRDQMTVPIRKLHKSNSLNLEQLAMVEPLAIGAHAVGRAGLHPEENTFIIGVGPIGLSTVASARAAGSRIIIMDIRQTRVSFCRDVLEINNWIEPSGDIIRQLQTVCAGELPTTVFDCTGNPSSMAASFNYVAHGGSLVFVGHFPGQLTFDDANFHARELTLMSSRNATPEDFRRIISRLETRRIDPTGWITHRAKPAKIMDAFPGWLDPDSGVVKVMVEWS